MRPVQCASYVPGRPPQAYYDDMQSEHVGLSTSVATTWQDALVVGNGTMGGMLFGEPGDERLVINRSGLFLPTNTPVDPPHLVPRLAQIREHAIAGRFAEAAREGVEAGRESGIDGLLWTDPFVPAAYLTLRHDYGADALEYLRTTSLTSGDASIRYEGEGSEVRVDVSAQTEDRSITLRIRRAAGLSGLALSLGFPELSAPEQDVLDRRFERTETRVSATSLTMQAVFAEGWPGSLSGYRVECEVSGAGDATAGDDGSLVIHDAADVAVRILVTLEARSGGRRQDGIRGDGAELLGPVQRTEIAERCSVELAGDADDRRTIEELQGDSANPRARNRLFEKLFAAGRMRVLQSTGDHPPTLTGIWGGSWTPDWSGDFTTNGNLQTAIEGMLSLGMSELILPVLSYFESLIPDFRRNASRLYGARGIYFPARMSSHGLMNHYNETYAHIFWIGGAAWAARFFYDYYRYTLDRAFLRDRALPFMIEAAAFYTDVLGEGDDPVAIVPSYSPENSPANVEGDVQVTRNATMDIDLIRELLSNTIAAHEALGTTHPDVRAWERLIDRLPPYHMNGDGAVSEWADPDLDDAYVHRHASHLYRLFYERPAVLDGDRELAGAFAIALEKRMEHRRAEQAGTMAFGLVQLGHAAISLRDAATTQQILLWLADGYWSPALTSTHDRGSIFNTDICGGLPNLMARSIIDGDGEHIDVLPALPQMWPDGRLVGVRLRGGWTATVYWTDGRVNELELTPATDRNVIVRYAGREASVSAKAGDRVALDGELERQS